jgi:hypothetical protein
MRSEEQSSGFAERKTDDELTVNYSAVTAEGGAHS